MNILKLTIANLREDLFSSIMNLVLLTLGVGTIVVMLLAGKEVEAGFFRNAHGIDLVVGAKGSPLQVILSSVYQMDVPTGNVPLTALEDLRKNPAVKVAIPVSMGDNYHGFRIVGTEPSYLGLYNLELAEGTKWNQTMECVLGADVERSTGLKVGESFAGAHGLVGETDIHKATPYKVAGILKPSGTIADRLILTGIDSPWRVHEYRDPDDKDNDEVGDPAHREVTSVLIQYSSPIAAVMFPRMINSQSNMQAAAPAFEISRLLSLLGVGINTLKAFGFVFVVISGIGVFAALFRSLRERRFELAIMRVQGASHWKLFFLVLLEGVLLGVGGAILGAILGHAAAYVIAYYLGTTFAVHAFVIAPSELFVFGGVILLAGLAALIPAVMAYRTDIAEVLARE